MNWLKTLDADHLEAVYSVMRLIGTEADRADAEHLRLRPRYGEIAVGGAHMDPFFRSEALNGLLRALRTGANPTDAIIVGNAEANLAIKIWNKSRRDYQVHRAVDGEQAKLQYYARLVADAAK